MLMFSSLVVALLHVSFLSSQITHNNILLLLHEEHNALHLCVFFSFFLFFCQSYPKYWKMPSKKKYFINYQIANAIQLFVCIKRKIFGSLLFQNKSQ